MQICKSLKMKLVAMFQSVQYIENQRLIDVET